MIRFKGSRNAKINFMIIFNPSDNWDYFRREVGVKKILIAYDNLSVVLLYGSETRILKRLNVCVLLKGKSYVK